MGWLYLTLAIASYYVLIYAYIQVLSNKNVYVLYSLVKIVFLLLTFFTCILFYKAKVNGESFMGLLFALAAMYLLTKNATLSVATL